MIYDGYDDHETEPSLLRRVRSVKESTILILLGLGLDAFVLAIMNNRSVLRFLVYPLQLSFLYAGYLAGSRVYRFLSKVQLISEEEKDRIDVLQVTTRTDWIAFAVGTLVGASVVFLLLSIVSHRMASAFNWDYQQRINSDE